jgi:predicted aspartyl protease
VVADRMSLLLRRGDHAAAAALAPDAEMEGRVALLEKLAEEGAWDVKGGEARVLWKLAYPLPLVNVKINGQIVLMAIDTGAGDLLVDESLARRAGIQPLIGQSLVLWDGSRVAVRNALVRRLEIGDLRIEKVPAGILPLRKWSNQINALSGQVAGVVGPVSGVIGVNLLRRFTPTLDYARRRLELKPPGSDPAVSVGAARVPFEIWGENEIMVYGTLAGHRRMALLLATGLPGAAIGAPPEVMDEIGVKPGGVSRLMKGAGAFMGGRPWYEVGVPGVAVGPLARDRVPGWSGALESAELWRHGVRRDAILGGEFFRDRRVTIDWQRMELRVEEGK